MVATDLRGYGNSEKPPSQPDHADYSFRDMAQDNVEVMASLGFDKFFAAGHDRGARVVHRMCLDHPDKVLRASIHDIIPQHHLFNHPTQAWATGAYHWFFKIQKPPMPERLMSADPDFFIEYKLSKTKQGLSFFGKEALEEYKRCFRNPETVRGMCEDYRACATYDLAMDTEDFKAGKKITARFSCCGARPDRSACKTIHRRSGSTMRATSATRRRSLAGTTSLRKRRKRPIAQCGPSLRRSPDEAQRNPAPSMWRRRSWVSRRSTGLQALSRRDRCGREEEIAHRVPEQVAVIAVADASARYAAG